MKLKSLLMFGAMLLTSFSLAAIDLKIEQEYRVETDRYDDYLFSGNHLEFKGEAKDLYFFGEQIDFTGKTNLALTALGRQVNAGGVIGNGIKAAGNSVVIDGITTGTNFLAGETILFEEESQIKGDTFVGARKLIVKGQLEGDLYAGAGEISIQNEIRGNVEVYAGQLSIPEQGRITGNLIYHSDRELSPEEASRVTGDIIFDRKDNGFFDENMDERFEGHSIWWSLLFKLSFAVFGLLILLIPATRFLEKRLKPREALHLSLWGLVPMLIYPSALVISILLVITIPLGISLALAFMPLLFLTKVIGITILGGALAHQTALNIESRHLYFLIGVVLYSLLSLIPVFGFLLMVFVSSIGCGYLLFSLIQKKVV